jgi:toxin-antitoxin system PIN domain toxin
MLMPDINVLAYAHRVGERQQQSYRDWLTRLVEGPEPFALSALVAVGFVRVVTNRRIYDDPSPLTLALSFVDELLNRPNCRVLLPSSGHMAEVARLSRAADVAGSAVADAQHAAVAIEHGCTLVTADRGFARFAAHGLRWEHLSL